MNGYIRQIKRSEIIFWVVLLVIAVAGVIVLRYITPYGLGLVNDSVGYIAGARSILAGHGYSRMTGDYITVPITNYPPMYSMVLAALGTTGLEIIRATRLLNMLCIAGNVMLVALSVRAISRSKLFGIFAAVLFLMSEPLVWIHSFAITEPLYLLLNMLVLLSFMLYLQRKNVIWLVLAGVLTSFAFLTRLVGLSIYLCIGLGILVFLPTWKKRMMDGLYFLAGSVPGAAVWAIRNALVAGNPSNRTVNYNPISDYKIQEGVGNFWRWLLPNDFVVVEQMNTIWLYLFLLVFFVLLGITTAGLWRSYRGNDTSVYTDRVEPNNTKPEGAISKKMFTIFLLQGMIYLSLVVFTLLFLDSSPIFEHRILSPFYLSLFIAGVGALGWMWQEKTRPLKILSLLIVAIVSVISLPDTITMAQWLSKTGQGFVSLGWRESSAVEIVRELPETTLISNRPTALYLLAERPAYALLAPVDAASREERPGYWENIDTIRQSILDGEAMLVVFNYRGYLDNPEESWWMERVTEGLPLYQEVWDGAIFGLLP